MRTDELRDLFQEAIVRSGETLHGTEVKGGLPRGAIRNVLDGHEPKVSRAADICRALGLEFYIGPPRDGAVAPPAAPSDDANQADAKDLPAPTLAARLDAIQADLRVVKSALLLEDASALSDAAANDDASPVNVISLAAAAGAGAAADDERVIGQCWFQRGWLAARNLNPRSCVVIGIKGESMEPTLPDGCSILVNRASRRLRDGRIFVLRGADGLIAKRAIEGDGAWRLASDHPAWEDIPWTPDHEVVGQVAWMARTLV